MKSYQFIRHTLTVLAVSCLGGDAFAAWTRLPSARNMCVNMASNALVGTTIKSSDGITRPNAIISDDPGDYFAIPKGESEVILQLARQSMVQSFNFLTQDAEGEVKIYGSTDSMNWVHLSGGAYSGANHFDCRFTGMLGKYFKVSFNATKGGQLRAFQLAGALTDGDITKTKNKIQSGKDNASGDQSSWDSDSDKKIRTIKGNESLVNYADSIGTPIYAHPTPINLDNNSTNNPRQTLKFPHTNERFLTIIYDLAYLRIIKKFSAAYVKKPVRLEVFIFERLPEEMDWRGKLSLNPAIFTTTKPVAIGEDPTGVGHINIPLKESVTARFVALRFEPNYQRAAAHGLESGWSEFLATIVNTLNELGVSTVEGGGRFIADKAGTTIVSPAILGFPGEAAGSFNAGKGTTTSTTNPDGSTTTTEGDGTTTTKLDNETTVSNPADDTTGTTSSENADNTVTSSGPGYFGGGYSGAGGGGTQANNENEDKKVITGRKKKKEKKKDPPASS